MGFTEWVGDREGGSGGVKEHLPAACLYQQVGSRVNELLPKLPWGNVLLIVHMDILLLYFPKLMLSSLFP